MKRRQTVLAGLFVVTLFAVTSAAGGLIAEPLDQYGKSHPWKGEVGKYTVIDFAAEWCAPCWHSLPEFQKLADRFPQLRFLVVSVDEKEQGRNRLVEDLELTVPVLWDDGYAIAEYYEPAGMPSTYLLDPAGKIIYQHTGTGESDWQALVEQVEAIASGLSAES